MFNHYRAAFEPRGSLSFSTAGVLGRLPASMVGLGVILFVSSRGDYGLAGTLVGVQALAACLGGPAQGRLADRFGQARTLAPTALVFGVALTGLILGLRDGAAFGVLAALSVLVGASSPTTGTLARSRWSMLHRPGAALQTAFAVEAVFDEVVFVTGPVLVTVLATRANPLIALVVGGAAGVVGSLLMAMQRRTEPPVAGRALRGATVDVGRPVGARSRLPYALLAPLLVAQLTVGTIFGSVDVTTVAQATATGHRQYAGLILACFSSGSLVAGLVVGGVNWRMSPTRRVRLCVCVLGSATLVLPLVPSIRLLPVAGFVIGLTVSPALVALVAAVQSLTPADRLTEAMAVANAALVAGFSLGSALAGQLIDLVGPHRAFLQAAAAGLLATVVVLAPAVTGRRSAVRRRRSAEAAAVAVSDRPVPDGSTPHAPAPHGSAADSVRPTTSKPARETAEPRETEPARDLSAAATRAGRIALTDGRERAAAGGSAAGRQAANGSTRAAAKPGGGASICPSAGEQDAEAAIEADTAVSADRADTAGADGADAAASADGAEARPKEKHGRFPGVARGTGLRRRPGQFGRIFRRVDRRADRHAPGPRRVSGRARRH